MMQRIGNAVEKLKDEKGFTLVEMALVLIIIGIIIGAIVKGKDLVRGAEQKRIYSKFMNGWRLAYLNFYDRTGKILGDTWDLNAGPAAAGQDGQADTAGGDASVPDAHAELVSSTDVANYRGLTDVGLTPPTSNTGSQWIYNYVDSQGTGHQVTIAFEWDGTNNYNYMMITNLPGELGMPLDTMVDGEADGVNGDFINTDAAGNPAAWPNDPLDDSTVNARWKMQF